MGAYSGPELVDDGLVLALDAANTRSYGGSGTTWTDISYRGNNGTLTNGPVFTQEPSLEPFGGAGAVSFDGTGDYLTTANSTSDFSFGTGDFTIEFWINSTQTTRTDPVGWNYSYNSAGWAGFIFNLSSSGDMAWYENGNSRISASSTGWNNGSWNHVSVTRSGNSVRMFLNGSQVGSTYTTSFTYGAANSGFIIGKIFTDPIYLNGYISNLRIVKGTALYTSNFTPKRQPLIPESAPNTVLLTCQKGTIRDRSPSAHSITINGDAKSISGASYFYFDGVDDYLSLNASVDFGFSNPSGNSNDFTIEWFKYWNSLSGYQTIWSNNYTSSPGLLIQTGNGDGKYRVFVGTQIFQETDTPVVGVWYHYALVRNGTTYTLYRNGDANGSATSSSAAGSGSDVATIGQGNGSFYENGFISNFRVYKGKGLTAAEVLQNYQNTKSRYGL